MLKLEAEKREQIFDEAIDDAGPSDGSVLLQVLKEIFYKYAKQSLFH